jgi:hypothetical protein
MNREQVEAALKAGVITQDQAQRLMTEFATVEATATAAPIEVGVDPDDEKFRILGGFNDIFVAIGVALLYGAFLLLAASIAPVLLSLAGAVAAWILAEVFTRRMRLALPSILLAVLFAVCVGSSVMLLYTVGLGRWRSGPFGTAVAMGSFAGFLAGISGLVAAYLHHRRFKVPIDWAIGAVSAAIAGFGLLGMAFGPRIFAWTTELAFVVGSSIFGLAMKLDTSDPLRQTRRSDAAFWLHLMAAPLLVHPLVSVVAGPVWQMNTATALLILCLFLAIALVAIIIDRRAILVSSLAYTGAALVFLVNRSSIGDGRTMLAVSILILALVVLSLSAWWRSIRMALLPLLPLGSYARFLPPAAARNI